MIDELLTEADIDSEAWMGGQREKVRELLRAYEKTQAEVAELRKFARPHDSECESLWPFLGSTRAPCNCVEVQDGPGTPYARLCYLLDELEKRFPGVVNPVMSDPPEPKLLAALDGRIASLKDVIRECLIDLRSPFPAEARVIAQLKMGDSSIEKAEKALAT